MGWLDADCFAACDAFVWLHVTAIAKELFPIGFTERYQLSIATRGVGLLRSPPPLPLLLAVEDDAFCCTRPGLWS